MIVFTRGMIAQEYNVVGCEATLEKLENTTKSGGLAHANLTLDCTLQILPTLYNALSLFKFCTIKAGAPQGSPPCALQELHIARSPEAKRSARSSVLCS